MGLDNSFVLGSSGAVAALALLLAACASAPAGEQTIVEAEPVEPVGTAMDEPAMAEPELMEPSPESGVRLKSDAPLRYVVKKGDTLWDISGYYLKDPWQWPELWYANPQVENPHLIYPGDELMLVWVDGVPRLTREPGEKGPVEVVRGDTEKLKPTVRREPLDEAIYTIPIEAIRAFLRGPRLVSKDDLEDAPYVVDFREDAVIAGADTTAYVLNLNDRNTVHYQVIRIGDEYYDPDGGDLLGYEARPVAESVVRVYGEQGEPASVYLTRSDIEARVGDYLVPIGKSELPARFQPRAPEGRVDGRIISVYEGLSQIGQFQIVAINRGTEHGLEPGHVLSIVQAGRTTKDPKSWYGRKVQLPDTHAGTLMVFQTESRLSHALVMSATRAIHVLDKVEKPDPSVQ